MAGRTSLASSCLRRASRAAGRSRGRDLPRVRARQWSPGDLHRRRGPADLPLTAATGNGGVRVAVPRLLPDEQPRPPSHRDAGSESGSRDAAAPQWLRADLQRATRARRPPLPGPLWRRPHRDGCTALDDCRVHRHESSARAEDWAWSSHQELLRGRSTGLVAVERVLELLGGSSRDPLGAYEALVGGSDPLSEGD